MSNVWSKEFIKALDDYFKHFGVNYPCIWGLGWYKETEEENIKAIEEAIKKNEPIDYKPEYKEGCEY